MYEMHAGELTLAAIREIPGSEPNEARPSFDALMAEHRPRVLRTAYRLLGRMEDAQDVCQEVFLRLLKHLDGLDAPPQAWLYRVTVNLCHDQFRRAKPVVEVVEYVDPAPGVDKVLEMSERKRLLAAGLGCLSERERTAIVLRDIEGLATREVAAILGVEEVTVRTQCASARAKLAKYVRRHA
ncbi:MAG: RNA polymerase sigma factor [Acidobacteriota bacterium]